MNSGASKQSLYGALLLSASGSLPMHIMPLLISTATAESFATVAQAGWISSACIFGQVAITMILALGGVVRFTTWHLVALLTGLVAGLWLAKSASFSILLVGWFVVGLGCGALFQLGVAVSAFSDNPKRALSIRLTLILALACIVILLTQLLYANYSSVIFSLGAAFICLGLMALVMYRPDLEARSIPVVAGQTDRMGVYGLLVIFLLFTGIAGFAAYSVELAIQRGLPLSGLVWSLLLAKGLAAVTLGVLAYRNQRAGHERFLHFAVTFFCFVGLLGMTIAETSTVFFVAVAVWEIALNLLGPRLQSYVIRINPAVGARWLTFAVLGGVFCGAPLHGLAIAAGIGDMFTAFAILVIALQHCFVHATTKLLEIRDRRAMQQ